MLGFGGAIAAIAGLTAGSGLWVALDMPGKAHPCAPQPERSAGAESAA